MYGVRILARATRVFLCWDPPAQGAGFQTGQQVARCECKDIAYDVAAIQGAQGEPKVGVEGGAVSLAVHGSG